MALKYAVKLSQVTNLTDARYAAGMGVDFIGFTFNSADLENDTLLTQRAEIAQWIVGPEIVLEDGGLSNEEVNTLFTKLPFAYIQTRNLKVVGERRLIYPILLTECCLKEMDTVLAEFPHAIFLISLIGSKVIPAIEEYLVQYAEKYQVLVNAPEYVGKDLLPLLEKVNPFGLELTGGEEERPGYRDMGQMMDILEALEVED